MTDDLLFPASPPRFARQMAVGDGHLVYVEECTAEHGAPVLSVSASDTLFKYGMVLYFGWQGSLIRASQTSRLVL